MSHKAIVTHPQEGPFSIPTKWARPEFTANDGFGDTGSLSVLDGMVLAFGFIDDNGLHCCGSALMVAPGLLVTATHVAEETRNTAGMAYSFLSDRKMRLWAPHQLHVLSGPLGSPLFGTPKRHITSDVTLVSCSLMSDAIEDHPLVMAHLEVCIPKVGERLYAVGYRQLSHDDVPGATMICSAGPVTDCHLEGRGSHLPGPCVEVSMNTLGGMSGGPVFNAEGHVVGIVSSSYEADDYRGPTYVSLILPAIVGTVDAPWPKGFWPNCQIGLSLAKHLGCARVHGNVFFQKEAVRLNRDEFYENYNNDFDPFLEEETLDFIETLPKHALKFLLKNAGYSPLPLSNFSQLSVSLTEGVEDPELIHCYTTDKNIVFVDYRFNLRIVDLDFEIPSLDYDSIKEIVDKDYYNIEIKDKFVSISCYVRVYLEVSFTHNIHEEYQSDFCVSKIYFK